MTFFLTFVHAQGVRRALHAFKCSEDPSMFQLLYAAHTDGGIKRTAMRKAVSSVKTRLLRKKKPRALLPEESLQEVVAFFPGSHRRCVSVLMSCRAKH